MLDKLGEVLVVAPHPDDEVLGAGGTIARLAGMNRAVTVVIMTRGDDVTATEKNRADALLAHEVLGVHETIFLDLPAAGLDTVRHAEVNAAVRDVIDSKRFDAVFLPFPGDIHRDHKEVFLSSLVAVRPLSRRVPAWTICYETLSETNWGAPFEQPGFRPNIYVSIEAVLQRKLEAFGKFSRQVKSAPHERSEMGIKALAQYRGFTVHCEAAEAFMLVRHIC